MPPGTGLVTIGGVKGAEERIAQIAFDENVDAAAIALPDVAGQWPATAGNSQLGRQLRVYARSAHRSIQLAADGQHRVPQGFPLEPAAVHAPTQPALGIDLGIVLVPR